MRYIFILDKQDILKYVAEDSGYVFLSGRFLLKDTEEIERGLFNDGDENPAFDIFLSRNIVYEYECEIAGKNVSDETILKKLIDNPLFDPREHLFTVIPDRSARDKGKAGLFSVFYFEKRWVDLIETFFISKGRIPAKTGILLSLLFEESLSKTERPCLYVEWSKSLEINLAVGKELLYSRHIPLMEEEYDGVLQEIIATAENIKNHFADRDKAVNVLAPPHYREKLRKDLENKWPGYAVHMLTTENLSARYKGDIWQDEYILSVIHCLDFHKAFVDLSENIHISTDSGGRHFRWVKAAAVSFFVIGFCGFLAMHTVRSRLEKSMRTSFSEFLPEESSTWDADKIYSHLNGSLQQKVLPADRVTEVFNNLIYCLPRDSVWELAVFKKEGDLYHINLLFKEEEEAAAFMKSAGKIPFWQVLDSRQKSGEVKLQCKVLKE